MPKNDRVTLRWKVVPCPLLLLGLAAFAQERDRDAERDEQTFRGQVGKVEGRALAVIQRKDGGEVREQTFTVDERTRILVDGEPARLEDLRPGANVSLVHRNGLVLRLEVPRARQGRDVVVEGVVKQAGEGTLRLEVAREDRRAAEENFKVHDDAAVFLGGEERGRLQDLKEGQRVRLSMREGTVRRIDVIRAERRREGEGDRPREGDKPRVEGDRPREGEKPRVEGDRPREGERPRAEGDRPREGEKPRVEGDRPREGRDGEGERRPVVLETPRKEEPYPVDERIVPKSDRQPDLGGRVVSVFEDGPSTLVTLKGRGAEFPVYLPRGTPLTFVGIENKEDQKPRAGYVCYVWLKDGSKDTAASARFGLEKRR